MAYDLARKIQHTPQSAFDMAVRMFTSPMVWNVLGTKTSDPWRCELTADGAEGLAYWIGYRAIRSTGRAPRTVAYYLKSATNFLAQYDRHTAIALIAEGADRYAAEVKY
jgi:hypothetical protein